MAENENEKLIGAIQKAIDAFKEGGKLYGKGYITQAEGNDVYNAFQNNEFEKATVIFQKIGTKMGEKLGGADKAEEILINTLGLDDTARVFGGKIPGSRSTDLDLGKVLTGAKGGLGKAWNWITENPGQAGLATAGFFMLMKGKDLIEKGGFFSYIMGPAVMALAVWLMSGKARDALSQGASQVAEEATKARPENAKAERELAHNYPRSGVITRPSVPATDWNINVDLAGRPGFRGPRPGHCG